MSPPVSLARVVADQVHNLLADDGNMQAARSLVEACLLDSAEGHIDAFRLSREDLLGFPVDPTAPFDPDDLDAPIMTDRQTATVISALHDIYCSGIEPIVLVAPDLTIASVAAAPERRSEWVRACRWHLIVEFVRRHADSHAEWFERQLRRFEQILASAAPRRIFGFRP